MLNCVAFCISPCSFLVNPRKKRFLLHLSGTTAVVALLRDFDLHVANAGDSRCVLCRKDGKAFDMSDDHKVSLNRGCITLTGLSSDPQFCSC